MRQSLTYPLKGLSTNIIYTPHIIDCTIVHVQNVNKGFLDHMLHKSCIHA